MSSSKLSTYLLTGLVALMLLSNSGCGDAIGQYSQEVRIAVFDQIQHQPARNVQVSLRQLMARTGLRIRAVSGVTDEGGAATLRIQAVEWVPLLGAKPSDITYNARCRIQVTGNGRTDVLEGSLEKDLPIKGAVFVVRILDRLPARQEKLDTSEEGCFTEQEKMQR